MSSRQREGEGLLGNMEASLTYSFDWQWLINYCSINELIIWLLKSLYAFYIRTSMKLGDTHMEEEAVHLYGLHSCVSRYFKAARIEKPLHRYLEDLHISK